MNNIMKEDMEYIYKSKISWDKLKDSTVLITGATGMIPSYMVLALLYINKVYPEYNIRIIALVRNSKKAEDRFKEYIGNKNLKILVTDVNDTINTNENIDYIIHGASLASSQFYNINPVGTILPNVLGTYQLLELARKNQVKSFLFLSSSEIYGEVSGIKDIRENDYGYIDLMDIRSCYGESKRMGENMCKAWQHQYGIATKVARIHHTYGPTLDIKNDKRVFSEFVSNVVFNKNIVMKSNGTSVRAFCYLSDAIIGLFIVMLEGADGEAYNLCNSKNLISIGELAKTLVGLFPKQDLKVVREERDEKDNYIENIKAPVITGNSSKLEQLGWNPYYSIEEGFKRTIQSFKYEFNLE